MRIAICQFSPTVGDIRGNTQLILNAIETAREQQADLLVTSELFLIGYPPRDLLFREGVVESCERAVQAIAAKAKDITVVVGYPRLRQAAGPGQPFHNAIAVCRDGRILAVYDKQLLPGYDVFDEDRYFEPGTESCVVDVPVGGGSSTARIGLLICEDLWRAEDVPELPGSSRYAPDPVADLAKERCDLVIVPSASPFVLHKWQRHVEQLRRAARVLHAPLLSVNQLGANDDLIFDGRTVLVQPDGGVTAAAPGWSERVAVIETQSIAATDAETLNPAPESELYHALVLGIRDYFRKTGHKRALIGLSGGIDSALTAVLASAALGPANVTGITMPSRFSSAGSVSDSVELAARLGLRECLTMPIEHAHASMRDALVKDGSFQGAGITDENIQSRIRGVLLMACANETQSLVLATGNKSEMAVGYCTIYGDMCGALAVLADVLKTQVYALARWINTSFASLGFTKPPIPEPSITKPPSAELRPNQTDQDTLPPYELLDDLIHRFINLQHSADRIIADTSLDPALVRRWCRTIDLAEFKRRQAAIILKVSPRTFGPGRPMPIAMKSTLHSPSLEGRGQGGG